MSDEARPTSPNSIIAATSPSESTIAAIPHEHTRQTFSKDLVAATVSGESVVAMASQEHAHPPPENIIATTVPSESTMSMPDDSRPTKRAK
jgi:hypothetical protein